MGELAVKKSRLIALASVLMVSGFAPTSHAAPIELVVNGEFENPLLAGSWNSYSNAQVPGWSSSANILEFWVQGYSSSPVNGSDGLPTGQHYELTYYISCGNNVTDHDRYRTKWHG
jgi:hypothetical protein